VTKRVLKLTIELIPSTCWGSNLREALSKSEWDDLRHQTYNEYSHKCGICGASGRLNCHELWKWDDGEHRQILGGLIALCDLCHHVKHIGFAEVLAGEGKLDINDVISHFCLVNRCARSDFRQHYDAALSIYEKRSQHEWTTDFGPYLASFHKKLDSTQLAEVTVIASRLSEQVGCPFDPSEDEATIQAMANMGFTSGRYLQSECLAALSGNTAHSYFHPVLSDIAQHRNLVGEKGTEEAGE